MEDKMKSYLDSFKNVYFSGIYGTEEGDMILKTKSKILGLDENECEKNQQMRIDNYEKYLSISKEFINNLGINSEILTEELKGIQKDLGLSDDEVTKLESGRKNTSTERADYTITYLDKDSGKNEKIEFKNILINELPVEYFSEYYTIIKDDEEIQNYKFTDKDDKVILGIKLSTISDLKKINHYNGYGKLYVSKAYSENYYQLYQEGEFKDGKLNGHGKSYYNGQLAMEGEFKDGKLAKISSSNSVSPIQVQSSLESFEERSNELRCPKCRSTNLSANKKGFGLGKAVGGGILLGGIGLLGGFIGSGKVQVTCLKCGYKWNAGRK